jgi:hypothetical protein
MLAFTLIGTVVLVAYFVHHIVIDRRAAAVQEFAERLGRPEPPTWNE